MEYLAFDNYKLDLKHLTLLKDGKVIHLQPKVVETLLVLAENKGRILSKNELMERLWPDTFVEEANLKQNISLLRKALGDNIDDPVYIETIPRRGYRFLAEVYSVDESGARMDEPTGPRKSGRKRRIIYILAGLATIILTGAALIQAFRVLRPKPLPQVRVQRLTTQGDVTAAAISPDALSIGYVSSQNIWVMDIASRRERRLTSNSNVHYRGINFSPDGKYICFGMRHLDEEMFSAYRIPVGGGSQEKVVDRVDSQIAFSPDGSRICYMREDQSIGQTSIYVSGADGTLPRLLAAYNSPVHISVEGVDWSPDGSKVVYPIFTTTPEFHFKIIVVDVETGRQSRIGDQDWIWLMRVVWGRDERELILAGRLKGSGPIYSLWRLPVSGGGPALLVRDFNSYDNPSLSADKRKMVTTIFDYRGDIEIIDLDHPDEIHNLTGKPTAMNGIKGLDWARDGRIIYTAVENGFQNLWTINSDGNDKRKLTEDSDDDDHFLTVSPDGRRVAYVSRRGGPPQIWETDLVTGKSSRITSGGFDLKPKYTPDGQWLVYSTETHGTRNIYKLQLNDPRNATPIRLTTQFSDFADISPDGRKIVCHYMDSRDKAVRAAIISMSAGDAEIRVLDIPIIVNRATIRWHPSGQALCYLDPAEGTKNIWVKPLDGGKSYRLTNYPSEKINYYAWSPDGRRLAISRGSTTRDVFLVEGIY